MLHEIWKKWGLPLLLQPRLLLWQEIGILCGLWRSWVKYVCFFREFCAMGFRYYIIWLNGRWMLNLCVLSVLIMWRILFIFLSTVTFQEWFGRYLICLLKHFFNDHSNVWEWISSVKHLLISSLSLCACAGVFCIPVTSWYMTKSKKIHSSCCSLLLLPTAVQGGSNSLLLSATTWIRIAIKINVDASLFAAQTAAGLGIIARDAAGDVLRWRQRLISQSHY